MYINEGNGYKKSLCKGLAFTQAISTFIKIRIVAYPEIIA